MNVVTPTRLRPFQAVFLTGVAWGVMVGLGAGGLVILVGLGDRPVLRWVIPGAAAGLAFLWSIHRVALEVDKDEIRVFNVRKTYRIPWETVTRVDVVAWWLSPSVLIVGTAAARITTRTGERIVIDASLEQYPEVRQLLARFRPRPEIFGY